MDWLGIMAQTPQAESTTPKIGAAMSDTRLFSALRELGDILSAPGVPAQ